MSEKYYTVGVPMTALPRPLTTLHYALTHAAASANHIHPLTGIKSSPTLRQLLNQPPIACASLVGNLSAGAGLAPNATASGEAVTTLSSAVAMGGASVVKHDCSTNSGPGRDPLVANASTRAPPASLLHICTLAKDDLFGSKDAKFSSGLHVSCPYLTCSYKNSQFHTSGRFPAEFLLNHLHSNHKHRRFNGDTLELTMIVPQLDSSGMAAAAANPTAIGISGLPLVTTTSAASSSAAGAAVVGSPSTAEMRRAASINNLSGGDDGRSPANATGSGGGPVLSTQSLRIHRHKHHHHSHHHSNHGGSSYSLDQQHGALSAPLTQTWPFVEIYSYKRYFYLEAQTFNMDGHGELFLWLWFLGTEQEEAHFSYQLTVVHGKSQYSYTGPVLSMARTYHDVRNDGRCLVIRERIWDYMSYKLKINKH